MKTIYVIVGLVALYLYSKGQLASSIEASFPVATTLLQDVTGSAPQPNQQNIAPAPAKIAVNPVTMAHAVGTVVA